MFSMPSRFLKVITPSLAERGRTARARAEGRGAGSSFGSYGGASRSSGFGTSGGAGRSGGSSGSSGFGSSGYGSSGYGTRTNTGQGAGFGAARTGNFSTPNRRAVDNAPEDESQDQPMLRAGERVKHAKFGSGTIAEITGSGRDTKVRIDFDDEEIGRKTLVLAQAKLERGWE